MGGEAEYGSNCENDEAVCVLLAIWGISKIADCVIPEADSSCCCCSPSAVAVAVAVGVHTADANAGGARIKWMDEKGPTNYGRMEDRNIQKYCILTTYPSIYLLDQANQTVAHRDEEVQAP